MPDPSTSFTLAASNHRAGRAEEAEKHYLAALEEAPDHPGALFNLAALLAAQGRFEEAERYYGRVVELDPSDPAVRSNLGNLMQTQKRFGEAEAFYREAIELDPGLAEAHINLGNLQYTQGDLEAAVDSFRRGAEAKPDLAHVRSSLGATLALLDRDDEAEAAFSAAHGLDPKDLDALNGLGGLRFGKRDYKGALDYYERATEADPKSPVAHTSMGTALDKLERQDEAIASYRRAIEADPDHLEALVHLARLLTGQKSFDEVETILEHSRSLRPSDAEVEFHFGNLYLAKGESERAIDHFEAALDMRGDLSEALNNLGNALQNVGRVEEAIKTFHKAIEANPESAFAWNNLGNALTAQKKLDEALDAYRRATEIDPDLDLAVINLGNALRATDRLDEARAHFDGVLGTNPYLYAAYNGLGLTYQAYHQHDKAIEAFKKAVTIKPHYAPALNNLAISCQDLGLHGEAIKAYQEVLEHHPELTEVYFNLGTLLQLISRFDESVVVFQKALEFRPDYDIVYPYLMHGLMQQCSWTNLDAVVSKVLSNSEHQIARGEEVHVSAFALQSIPASVELRLAAARQISKRAENKVEDLKRSRPPFKRRKTRRSKITVGFISPDFRFHSVAVAFKGILAARDRDKFEYQGYAINTYGEDGMSLYFESEFDKYVDITRMSYTDAADAIYDNHVDVLIDLAGHTRGGRYEVLAFKPAPVQAHWLGFSSTTGATFIDYLITDKIQVPPEDEKFCSEKLLYLPDTFMATSRHDATPVSTDRTATGLPPKGFVFANFNSHYKFYPLMFAIWMRLLRQVPDSVLWMVQGTETSRKNLCAEAEKRGVDPSRLVFAPKITHPEHLGRLIHVDLCLDNMYHGGGVTTTDALFVGVPVLTLSGESPPSRNGATLVNAIGAPELIAYSLGEYEKKTLELVRDPLRLAELKLKLQTNRDTYPLFDHERLTRHLETGFEMMWENYLAGNGPRTMEVPALAMGSDRCGGDEAPDHLLKDAV